MKNYRDISGAGKSSTQLELDRTRRALAKLNDDVKIARDVERAARTDLEEARSRKKSGERLDLETFERALSASRLLMQRRF